MTTLGNLVAQGRRMLRGARREVFNQLDVGVTTETSLRLQRAVAPIANNTYIGIGAEIAYVIATDPGAQTVEVMRGVDDTPIDPHTAGDLVEVDWRWFTADLFGFLADEIRSWPDDIFAVTEVDVTLGIGQRAVDLPLTRYRMPLRVRRRSSNPNTSISTWVDVPLRQRRIETNLPTDQFPSGNVLIAATNPTTSDWRIEYAQEFDLSGLADLTTDITTLPLNDRLIDAAIYGIAWRALASDEAARSNDASQPEPRDAAEVKALDRIHVASSYKAIRDQRLEEEKRRLRQLYPVKFT